MYQVFLNFCSARNVWLQQLGTVFLIVVVIALYFTGWYVVLDLFPDSIVCTGTLGCPSPAFIAVGFLFVLVLILVCALFWLVIMCTRALLCDPLREEWQRAVEELDERQQHI